MKYWVDIKFNSNYEVSNRGDVRNKRTGRMLSQHLNRPNGYLRVTIDGVHYYVHRLVADSFFEGDHRNLEVNHIDGDKCNNCIGNLEWVTRQENMRHASENGFVRQPKKSIVKCRFCRHRYKFDICDGKSDNFYCGYGER